MKSKEQLRKVFENGDKPTQDDFWEWQDSYWHKEEMIPKDSVEGLNESFFQEGKETLTVLEQPTLTGNILTLNYVGENGVTQSVNVDLSSLHTLDVNVSGAIFNASNNIITLTETDGESFQIDLSQLQIVATTDSNGTTTVSQEGSNKLTISKAGQSGNYSDLSGLPDLTAFITLSSLNSKADKSIQINTTTPLQGGGDLSGNRTISIQQANSLQNGYLSNTDWNTFNNKMTAPTMTNNNVGRWDDPNKKFIDGVLQDDGTKIGIGGTSSNDILAPRIKVYPLNGKLFNLNGINNSNTIPNTNLYSPNGSAGDVWTDSGSIFYSIGSNDHRRITSLCREDSPSIFTGMDFNTINNGLQNIYYNYGYKITDTSKPNNTYIATNADPRMYSGGVLTMKAGTTGSQLVIDIKGNLFARGFSGFGETDWKKFLSDNQYKTTTLGSETTYANIKWAIDSTTQAALIAPRMTQTQRLAITLGTTQSGAIIYQTDGVIGYYLWNGTSWQILDSNIANNDLTNTSARTFTQNASFNWDTLGNPYFIKGLVDKSSDSNFNKILVEDSNGSVATTTNVPIFPINFKYGLGNNNISNSTAYGILSLSSQSSGINGNNSAFGYNTLKSLTTGIYNSAFGSNALLSLVNSNDNSAFGYNTLQATTIGGSSAFGSNALSLNTTGVNSAFGVNSLKNNTTGTGNSAFGLNYGLGGTLENNTTGSGNSAFGVASLKNNTTGTNNSGFGSQTFFNLNSGNSNLAIGSLAGRHYTGSQNLTTSNNSIFIGYNAMAYADNSTNEIVIGYNSIGNGNNTITFGNDSITKTFLKGKTILNERLKLMSYTKTQRDALSNKEVGDMIFQTDTGNSGIRIYNGTNWLAIPTTTD